MWEHTTLGGEALSFTRYPVELDREDVTRSSLFIYLPVGPFFSASSFFVTVPLSVRASPDTQYLDLLLSSP